MITRVHVHSCQIWLLNKPREEKWVLPLTTGCSEKNKNKNKNKHQLKNIVGKAPGSLCQISRVFLEEKSEYSVKCVFLHASEKKNDYKKIANP